MSIGLSVNFAQAWAYVVAAGVLIGIVAGIDAIVKRKDDIPPDPDEDEGTEQGD